MTDKVDVAAVRVQLKQYITLINSTNRMKCESCNSMSWDDWDEDENMFEGIAHPPDCLIKRCVSLCAEVLALRPLEEENEWLYNELHHTQSQFERILIKSIAQQAENAKLKEEVAKLKRLDVTGGTFRNGIPE